MKVHRNKETGALALAGVCMDRAVHIRQLNHAHTRVARYSGFLNSGTGHAISSSMSLLVHTRRR